MINVNRRAIAPESLAAQKSYRNSDVLEALFEDFSQKCYLTEFRFSDMGSMEVDHFVTQHENSSLTYEWSNLFPINEKANKKRPKSTPIGGYLNPCNEQDDVENDIIYKVHFSGLVSFTAKDPANTKAVNTAALLTHVHKEFTGAIKERHHEILDTLREWESAIKAKDITRVAEKEFLLRVLLSRGGQFTMLMRATTDVPAYLFD